MTDETRDTGSADNDLPSPGAGGFSTGEGLVALAGLVVVAVWLIFEVIAREYFVNTVTVLIAATAALLPRLRREEVERVAPLGLLMKAIGFGLVLVGVVEILTDVRAEIYDEFAAILGALIAYVAYALAFFGARQIET